MPDRLPRPAVPQKKLGVLLVNLGTPARPDYWGIRRYLKEFLSDRRVVETPRILWWPILHLIILSLRPLRSARAYQKIWDRSTNESPLTRITREQAEALSAMAQSDLARGQEAPAPEPASEFAYEVVWAMRYGKPSIVQGIDKLVNLGTDRLLVLPLYPQYSATTTASVADAVFAALARHRFQPALRLAAPYYDKLAYINALAASLQKCLAGLAFAPDVILVSFHGIPQAYADKGDPYPAQCEATFALLTKAFAAGGAPWRMCYQSRFGPTEWLKPYASETIVTLARQGVKNLVVITPGFAADCLETLQEIAIENRELFHANGGANFALVPCLNASAEGMSLIRYLVRCELGGWL